MVGALRRCSLEEFWERRRTACGATDRAVVWQNSMEPCSYKKSDRVILCVPNIETITSYYQVIRKIVYAVFAVRGANFRDAVLAAYGGRCAISQIPEPRLLDAADIVMDADEQLGQPIVSNGLPLTKLHHAAFDAHLIGIDPDYRIHVSDRLFEIYDGPLLELGLKGIA